MNGGGAHIQPAGDRLAVVDLPEEEKAGLILPPDVGIVQEVGADVRLQVEKGDKVFYHCNATEVEGVKIIDGGCVIAFDTSARSF